MEVKESKQIENIADIKLHDNNILLIAMADRSDIDLKAAEQISEVAGRIADDIVHANLVDIRQMTFMSSEARKHFADQNKKTVKAVAILANSSFHKPLVNLYLKFSKPGLPTKIFDSKDKAIEWLEEILNKN